MANLYIGCQGLEVVNLQKALNQQLYPRPGLAEDGIFGPLTKNAVKAFQRQAGLSDDGIAGPMTKAALGLPDNGVAFTHKVRLHFRSLDLTDVYFETILSSTQAVYAPYGIRVEYGSGESLMLEDDQRARLEQVDGSCKWTVTGGEYQEIQQLGSPVPANDITVYFINRFTVSLNGCGGHMPNRPACIVAKAGSRWCTAHEVCHVLLSSTFRPVHIEDAANLMHSVDLARAKTPGLTDSQVQQIKRSSCCHPM
jgi:hypothetical protein